jgi:hypothetical protein
LSVTYTPLTSPILTNHWKYVEQINSGGRGIKGGANIPALSFLPLSFFRTSALIALDPLPHHFLLRLALWQIDRV